MFCILLQFDLGGHMVLVSVLLMICDNGRQVLLGVFTLSFDQNQIRAMYRFQ